MDKLLELLCPSDFPAVEHGGSALQTLAQQFSPDAYATAVASLSASGDAEPSIQLAHVHMLAAARLRDITEAVNAADLAAALYERGDAPTEHVHFALGRALQRDSANLERADALLRRLEDDGAARGQALLLRWMLESDRWDETEAVEYWEALGTLHRERLQSPAQAIDAWSRCLDLDPGRVECSDSLATLLHAAGLLERSLDTLERALIAGGDDPVLLASFHVRAARLQLALGEDVAGAARHLQNAIKLNPDDYDALRAFGILYQESGRTTAQGAQKAAAVFVKAGRTAFRQGAVEAATRLLRRALGIDPSSSEAFESLESVLIEREMWIELDENYVAWLEAIDGDARPGVLSRRAENLYARLERREDARIAYEEVRQHQPPDGPAWTALRSIYEAIEDWTALTSLIEAQHEVLDDALDTESLLIAARTYRDHLDNDERASHFYYLILARDPFHAEAFEGYKEHWRRKHNWTYLRDVILYQIDQAEEAHPDGPLTEERFAEEFVELADICERRIGDVAGALDAWQRLEQWFPADGRSRAQVSRIEKRARMWDNMVKVQEAELSRTRDPKSRISILKRLVQIYRDRQVDPERAIELYLEILEHSPDDLQSRRALTALYDRASRYEEVVEMLQAQHDRSRSRTERCALLRRLSELWHHELKEIDRAIWACEAILEEDAADLDAMHRLQLIYQEQGQWQLLLKIMSAEVKVLERLEDKMALLRRMARIAGFELKREDLAFKIWKQLHALDRGNLEIVDTLAVHYAEHGPDDALAELLQDAGSLDSTPPIRQLDYALRLGRLTRDRLVDNEGAQRAFERALDLRHDHRGALQALADIYREQELYPQLCAVLTQLETMADTESETWSLASERANYLAEHLESPEDAASALIGASAELAYGGGDLNMRILDCFEAAEDPEGVTLHAELALLAKDTTANQARDLLRQIADARASLGDLSGSLLTVERALMRFPGDVDFVELKLKFLEQTFRFRQALELVSGEDASAANDLGALLRRAQIEAERLLDIDCAATTLESAMMLAAEDPRVKSASQDFARRHERWDWLASTLAALAEAATDLETRHRRFGEIAVIHEEHLLDGTAAFAWAVRRYEVFDPHQPHSGEALVEVRRIAENFELWGEFVAALERASEVPALVEHRALLASLLLEASQICDEELSEPRRAAELLEGITGSDQRAEAEERMQALIDRHALHDVHARLLRRRMERSSGGDRLEYGISLASLLATELDQSGDAFQCLRDRSAELEVDDPGQEALKTATQKLAADTGHQAEWAGYLGAIAARRIARGDVGDAVAELRTASATIAETSGARIDGLRVLLSGLTAGPAAAELLDDARAMCAEMESEPEHGPLRAALARLTLLEIELGWRRDDAVERARIFRQRAELRQDELGDSLGACAEWIRALAASPDDEAVLTSAVAHACSTGHGPMSLLMLGVVAEAVSGSARAAELRERVTTTYADELSRPDLALRAALRVWRDDPQLPPREGELGPLHQRTWDWARQSASWETSPELELPVCLPPEPADLERWAALGDAPLSSRAVIGPISTGVPATTAPVETTPLESIEDLGSGSFESLDDAEFESLDIDEIDELDEIEELEELEELEEVSIDEEVVQPPPGPPTRPPPPRRGPPPPRRDRPATLSVPGLADALVVPMGGATSGWELLDAAYARAASEGEVDGTDATLARARLWRDGAADVAQARVLLEEVCIADELPDDVFRTLEDTFEGAAGPLAESLERVLDASVDPGVSLRLRRRLAALYHELEDGPRARGHLEAICDLDQDDTESLDSLIENLAATDDRADELSWRTARLQRSRGTVDEDAYVEAGLDLAGRYAEELDDDAECITRITRLMREYPQAAAAPLRLAEFRFSREEWPKGVDVLKTALESRGDDETFASVARRRMAAVYEDHLNLPARAIGCWEAVRDAEPEATDYLQPLRRLYIAAGRAEEALALVDAELATGDDARRLELLRTKVDALAGLPERRQDWLATLRAMLEVDADNDGTRADLVDALTTDKAFDEAEALTRARFEGSEGKDRLSWGVRLAHLVAAGRREKAEALGLLDDLASDGDSAVLVDARVTIARAFDDTERLAVALSQTDDADQWLEAGLLLLRRVQDPERARAQIERVIEHEISQETDGPARLLAAADAIASCLHALDQPDAIVPYMEGLLGREGLPTPVTARILSLLARHEFAVSGDLEQARARFERALETNPDELPALIGLAKLLTSAGKHAEAEPLAERALEQPEIVEEPALRVDALSVLATCLEADGRHGEAYRKLTAALRERPDEVRLRLAVGRNRMDASRYKDVVVAAEQFRQWLDGKDADDLTPEDRNRGARLLALGARAEREQGRDEPAISLLSDALDLDPQSSHALEQKLELATSKDRFLEVFDAADALRAASSDEDERDELMMQLLSAGPLAVATAEGSSDELARVGQRTLNLFDELLRGIKEGRLETAERGSLVGVLEAATSFALQERAFESAMASYEQLLAWADTDARRFSLRFSAAEAALESDAESALTHALEALILRPNDAAAVYLQVQALQRLDRSGEIEEVVRALPTDEPATLTADNRGTFAEVLRFWSEHAQRDELVVEGLERALQLDEAQVTLDDRQRLAAAYNRLERSTAAALDNHRAIVAADPTSGASLRALAAASERDGELLRAYAFHELLQALGDEASAEFLKGHTIKLQGAKAPDGAPEDAFGAAPSGGAMHEVLGEVWSQASAAFQTHLGAEDPTEDRKISAVDDDPVARCWSSALKRSGPSRTTLVRGGHEDGPLVRVRCQSPPLLEVRADAGDASREVLTVALLRGLAMSRIPDAILVGLDPGDRRQIISAVLRVTHPRYTRRRGALPDEPTSLIQELTRVLPLKLTRTLTGKLQEMGDDPYDTHSWSDFIENRAACFALARTGALAPTLELEGPSDTPLATRAHADAGLRRRLSFHVSDVCIEARAHVGFTCVEASDGEAADAPPG